MINNDMKIKKADKNNIKNIVALTKDMHLESVYGKFDYDEPKVKALISYLIEDDSGIVLIAIENDEIIGGFMGCITQYFFGTHNIAFDYGLYVKPEHRGTVAAPFLLQEYIKTAQEHDVKEISLGISTGNNIEKIAKLYIKMGFKHSGDNFKMEIK